MQNSNASFYVVPAELRVGMYVHLDLDWMSHPFPRSSFKIGSADQIQSIQQLGLDKVRWVPKFSESQFLVSEPPRHEQAEPEPAAQAQTEQELHSNGACAPEAINVVSDSLERKRLERKTRLAEQRKSNQWCERQYAQAVGEFKHTMQQLRSSPTDAHASAEALIQALLDKMLPEQDLCIRLLMDGAGDKASAHAVNVTIIAMLMGKALGMQPNELFELGVGALLHDMGKLELPSRVHFREDHFNPSELRSYQEHVSLGLTMARRMELTPASILVIAQHHEHADGSGFPQRLGVERMSAGARIVALVNRYDNLCNPSAASHALTPHEALSQLFTQGKNKFDTAILGAFIKMMGVYPAGSTVQLTDDRYAMVVGVNSSRPLKPRVLVHQTDVPAEEALVLDLESAPNLGIRRSVRHSAMPAAARDYLSPRPRIAYFFEPVRAEGALL
jgi:putative nucleotidyltransferase with HDIG domain